MNHLLPVSFSVRIRPCNKADLEELEWFGLFTSDRQIIRGAFRKQMRGEGLMLVAEGNGHIVGQVWINFRRFAHRGAGFLWAFRVTPWLQGLGIGSMLLNAAEEELRARGFRYAEVSVDTDNPDAKALYERREYSFGGLGDPGVVLDEAGRKHRFYRWILRKDLHEDLSAGRNEASAA